MTNYTIPKLPPVRAWMSLFDDVVYCRPEIADAVLAAIQRVSPSARVYVPPSYIMSIHDGSRSTTVKIRTGNEHTVLARAAVRNCLHDFNQWILPKTSELLPIEPDGVQGYEYTIEARYGVPVGADWLPVAARRKVAVSLFHPAMLCEAA